MISRPLPLRPALACAALALFGALSWGAASLAPTAADAEENAVTFPPLNVLEHYTTVRRGITREHMLTTQAALDAIRAEEPVPTGTHVVLVDYQSDVLTRYLVAQKLGEGIDDWGYQWFWPDETVKTDENIDRCYACHQRSRRDREFMFTHDDAVNFTP